MKNGPPVRATSLVLLTALSLGCLGACCPTGAWEDNFGSLYALVTLPPAEFETPLETIGTVDTRGIGCGVWSLRPPAEGEPPIDPDNPLAWVVENPHPNPSDGCCYAFRFDGRLIGSGCTLIVGQYRNVGGKCEQSGPMLLESVR